MQDGFTFLPFIPALSADSQNRLLNSQAIQPEVSNEEDDDDEEEEEEEEEKLTLAAASIPSLSVVVLSLVLPFFVTSCLPFEHGSSPFLVSCICLENKITELFSMTCRTDPMKHVAPIFTIALGCGLSINIFFDLCDSSVESVLRALLRPMSWSK